METKVKDLVQSAIGKIQELSDADTIIGKPIRVDGKITIIPVSKVSYGFAAGGSDLPTKSEHELFGGGSGAGVTIQPIAFLVINDGDVQLMQINKETSTADAIATLVPDLFSKVQSLFTKKKDKDDLLAEISDPLGDTSDFDF